MRCFRSVAILIVLGVEGNAFAAIASLGAVADTTLYQDAPGNSNGAGNGVFIGQIAFGANSARRGLVRFEFDSIPPGSQVQSATLGMSVVRTISGPTEVAAYRVLEFWGESSSNGPGTGAIAMPGDATWVSRFTADGTMPELHWATPGGQHSEHASATAMAADDDARVSWTSPALRDDVTRWIENPMSNHGWLLKGNENTLRTTKKFASREWPVIDQRPSLEIFYRIGGDTNNDDRVDFTDLLTLAQNYGTMAGASFDAGDFNNDGQVGFSDLLIVAQNYSQSRVEGSTTSSTQSGSHTDLEYFLRAAYCARGRMMR